MFFRDAEFPQRGNSAQIFAHSPPAFDGGTVPVRKNNALQNILWLFCI